MTLWGAGPTHKSFEEDLALDAFKNYYTILGVQPQDSTEHIRSAFRRMAKIYSPDKDPDPKKTALFEDVLEAWGVLSDPAARRAYDQSMGWWQQAQAAASVPGMGPEAQGWPSQTSPPQWSPQTARPSAPQGERPASARAYYQNVIQSSRRDVERQRMAEQQREAAREEMDGYLADGATITAVVSSFLLLIGTGLFGLPRPFVTRTVIELSLITLIFTGLFWLGAWGLLFSLRPEGRDIGSWKRTAALGASVIAGLLYGHAVPWALSLKDASFITWSACPILIFLGAFLSSTRDR